MDSTKEQFERYNAVWAEVDGVSIPSHFGDVGAEVAAIRRQTALQNRNHVCRLKLSGDEAYELLDGLCPCALYIRDGEVRHTLLLSEEGHPLLDLTLANDDESFFWLSEGMPTAEVLALLKAATPDGAEVQIEDLSASHAFFSVHGPFAWELMAQFESPQIIGFPYATFFHGDEDLVCFRLGKTGEYGYDLLIPWARAGAVWEELLTLGQRFGVAMVGFEAAQHCARENFVFNIWEEGRLPLTPLELQLQWRVSYDKEYPGHEVLARQREEGISRRLVAVASMTPMHEEEALLDEGEQVGQLVQVARSLSLDAWIGLALIALPWAHSGLRFALPPREEGERFVRTVSPPFVDNLSLFLNPQKHSYLEPDAFAPLRALQASCMAERKAALATTQREGS